MNNQTKDERIKDQIARAAATLFQKWGLRKTAMEDIAKAAHKGKSTLYYYFKSKDEIFEYIANREFNEILAKAYNSLRRETTAEGKLRAYFLCSLEQVREKSLAYEILFGEISSIETIITTLRRKRDEEERAIVREILAEGIRSGELKIQDDQTVSRLATMVVLTFRMTMLEFILRNEFDELEEMIKLGIRVIMNGLRS